MVACLQQKTKTQAKKKDSFLPFSFYSLPSRIPSEQKILAMASPVGFFCVYPAPFFAPALSPA